MVLFADIDGFVSKYANCRYAAVYEYHRVIDDDVVDTLVDANLTVFIAVAKLGALG